MISLIISSAGEIHLSDVFVKHSDASDVPLEDIIAIAIKSKVIYVTKPTITSKTMKKLLKLPNFLKLYHFAFYDLSEVFDIDEFYSYMKKNQHTQFYLNFDEQISEEYMNRLETIVDEIIETKQFNYKPPVIHFTGLAYQKYKKLL